MTEENENWREYLREDCPMWLKEHSESGDNVEWQSIEKPSSKPPSNESKSSTKPSTQDPTPGRKE